MSYLILGPLEVRDGTTEVALRGGQQRKLLTILLLHQGEAVSSDRLIEELWNGKPPGTAAKALQGYVSSLRKQLGQETIETVGAGYRLKVAAEQVDVHRFEALLAEARPLDRGPAVAKLKEALALWRGPALADFAYDDFAQQEIERLEELRLSATERRINLELALGHHDDLVPELEVLVGTHPLRERLRAHLMLALYRSGRQAEALEVYSNGRAVLLDELGLDPSEELQSLQRQILAHDPSLDPPSRDDAPTAARAGRPPKNRDLRRPLAAVVAGLAILGAAAAAIVLTQRRTSAIVVPPNSVAMIEGGGRRVESYAGVGRAPAAIALGARGVWVANGGSGTVERLAPASGKPVTTIGGIGSDVSGVAVGFGSVWVAGGTDGTVIPIDPRSNEPGGPIPLGPAPALAPTPVFFIAVDPHYVWVTRGAELVRIDPRSSQADLHLSVGTPTGLATGGGSVWVTTLDGRVLRIDPQAPARRDSLPLSNSASAPVYAWGSLWVIYQGDIQQIDPVTFTLGTTLSLAHGTPTSLAWGDGALWALDSEGGLTRFGRDGRPTASLHVSGHGLSAVAAGGGAAWVAVTR